MPLPPAPVKQRMRAPTEGLTGVPATWSIWEGLGAYLFAYLAGSIVAVVVFALIGDEDLATIVSSAVAALTILGLLLLWLTRRHHRWLDVLGRPSDLAADVRAGLIFGLGLYVVTVFVVGFVLVALFGALSGGSVEAPEQVSQNLPPVGVAVTIVYALVVAPIGEELFFRGVLFRSLRDPYGFWPGAVVSSLLFGAIHYIPAPALDSLLLITVMVFTGFGLTYIYERRRTIVAPIAAHMMFNAVGLVLIYAVR